MIYKLSVCSSPLRGNVPQQSPQKAAGTQTCGEPFPKSWLSGGWKYQDIKSLKNATSKHPLNASGFSHTRMSFYFIVFFNKAMDKKDPNRTPRKLKFIPKGKPKSQTTKIEAGVEDEQKNSEVRVRSLLERVGRRQPKVAKQSSAARDAFPRDSSLSLRSFGSGSGNGESSGSESKFSADDKYGSTHSSTAMDYQSYTSVIDVMDDTTDDEDYTEPWDPDTNSNYPTTLPLRKPNSGDPAILDKIEFGEAATDVKYDGDNLNSAAELGLLDKSEQPQLIFFKLPTVLPCVKQPVNNKGKEKIGTSKASAKAKKASNLLELPSGYMGKMQVYKSGAVKLKIGETLYDVSPGTKTILDQDVVAINTAKKNYSVVGKVTVDAKAVVTPDIDAIDLESIGL